MVTQNALDLNKLALKMRKHTMKLAYKAGGNGAHVGPALSIIDIMATLYGNVLNLDSTKSNWSERDRFILSKGHGALAYYVALHEAGFFSEEELYTFEEDEGFLPGQPVMNMEKGIEYSSGSLGVGLSFGIGIALSAKLKNQDFNTYVLMGDGECNEGTVWESAMSAAHFKLDNLVAIVDYNKMQSDGESVEILDMGNFSKKWESFGWHVIEVNGHDISELLEAFDNNEHESKPKVIIAHTIKGKGISYMEGNPDWHHGQVTTDLYKQAIEELGGE